ncbi:sigma-70 family RNA polymerase sigma factor [Streptomyces sp. TP-A0874]|uniref:sigma-70 family RNA polymerase sigma factor n=1 Tax=Streptomyces sp. TP-A0874 TaxID=549819 RepID=UPI0009A014FD|nr:sigma-70 family RNA polymerase sigma factor [Streptomyces sp. TP-A0874]
MGSDELDEARAGDEERTAGEVARSREASVPRQRDAEEAELPPGDGELLARLRGGDDNAYEELYRRHADAVRRYARSCCRDAHTAEDLTAEVFARALQAVRRGSGPESAVRAYLLTTVRRVAASWARTAKREQLIEDFAVFAAAAANTALDEAGSELGADVRAMHEAERSLAVRAFRSLPERWQTVLWHTTVEEGSPSEVAPLLGLTANATAVLAHRAREGLRQAYLQAHVSSTLTSGSTGGDCARYADRLGAFARGGLRTRAERGLREHLADCTRCHRAALELKDVNERLRALLPVAVIGWFAAGYAVKAAGAVAGAAGAAAGAGAAAAAGGAGGSAASAGGALSKGAGLPLKLGVAAGVVAATAATVFALTSGEADAPVESRPRPSVLPTAPPSSSAPPAPEPTATPPVVAGHQPAPPAAATSEPAPKPSRKPASRPAPSKPAPGKPTPPEPPTPEPQPSSVPPPPEVTPPAAQDYPVNRLAFDLVGDGSAPEVRLGASSWLWRRYGLVIGGSRYEHGVTVPAASSVLIDLNRSCTRYTAVAGVGDGPAGRHGSVLFSVYGDETLLWRSEPVRGGDPAVPVNVSLAGRKTLRLVVEPDRGSLPVGLASWADSRISCS